MNNDLSDKQIVEQYNFIKKYHEKYLKKYNVKMPSLYISQNNFTKNALVLVYLSIGYPETKKVSKLELTHFIRKYYPNVPDVQQARHLGAQDGWWIVAGGRDNIVLEMERGFYQLYTLEKPYPSFKKGHRVSNVDNWEDIKAAYHYRCATCGSKEGKPHLHWKETITKLQKSHKDPSKPLTTNNIIPQCQKCNRADRNRWVYDDYGRVIKLAKASFVKNFDPEIRWKIYKILYDEYKGINPNE